MSTQAVVQRACAKLRSAIGDEAVARSNFTADLRDMLKALEAIQLALDKAEMWLFRDERMAFWLQRALNAAYKTIDTVDELLDARSQAAATMTRMLPRLAIMKNAMATEVQETKKLLMRAHERSRALSEYMVENTIMFQEIIAERKTRAGFEEAMVVGRGSDKERIIAALLSTVPNVTQEHITILPIFGLACIGKTTLAQMVFNDIHSLQGYDFRVWVHVSPQFDFHTIGNSIICHVSGRGQEEINDSSSDVEGIESIMQRLHKLLNGKKVLLVLDDLWEENPIQLQLLKSMLTFLGHKMEVIVTTCNQAIARKICTVEPYRLNPLGDDSCWEIVKKSIHLEEGQEELEKIGQEIASKCRGVPSIAREYAGMLDSSRDAMTWKKTMEEDVWLNIAAFGSAVPLALSRFELSYRSMPPNLRLCFEYYCGIEEDTSLHSCVFLIHVFYRYHKSKRPKFFSLPEPSPPPPLFVKSSPSVVFSSFHLPRPLLPETGSHTETIVLREGHRRNNVGASVLLGPAALSCALQPVTRWWERATHKDICSQVDVDVATCEWGRVVL